MPKPRHSAGMDIHMVRIFTLNHHKEHAQNLQHLQSPYIEISLREMIFQLVNSVVLACSKAPHLYCEFQYSSGILNPNIYQSKFMPLPFLQFGLDLKGLELELEKTLTMIKPSKNYLQIISLPSPLPHIPPS